MVIRKTKHWVFTITLFFLANIVYFYFTGGLFLWPLYLFFSLVIVFFIVFYLSHYLEISNDRIIFRYFPFREDVININDIESCQSIFGVGGPFTPIRRFEIKVKRGKTLKINIKHYKENDFKKFVKMLDQKIKK